MWMGPLPVSWASLAESDDRTSLVAGSAGGSSPNVPGRSGLEVLADPQGVVDGGVDVAAGERIAHAEEQKFARWVREHRLQAVMGEGVIVDLAAVAGAVLQVEIDPVARQGAVLGHHLVHHPLLLLV